MRAIFSQKSKHQYQGYRKYLLSLRNWINAGDPPPKAQVNSLYLILFLFSIGFSALMVFIFAYLKICFYEYITSLVPLGAIAFLTLTPSVYGAYVAFCCWRRVYGYDWYMIPNFD